MYLHHANTTTRGFLERISITYTYYLAGRYGHAESCPTLQTHIMLLKYTGCQIWQHEHRISHYITDITE